MYKCLFFSQLNQGNENCSTCSQDISSSTRMDYQNIAIILHQPIHTHQRNHSITLQKKVSSEWKSCELWHPLQCVLLLQCGALKYDTPFWSMTKNKAFQQSRCFRWMLTCIYVYLVNYRNNTVNSGNMNGNII